MSEPPVPEILDTQFEAQQPTGSVALTHHHHAPRSTALVAGANATERIAAATEIATQLDNVIKAQNLRTKIGSKKVTGPDGRDQWVDNFHIDVEAWQTLAAFLELAVVPVWARMVTDPATGDAIRSRYTVRREFFAKGTKREQIKNGTATVERVETAEVDGYSWEARVEVFKDGQIVSAGESMCTREEESWRDDEDQRLRSMAQTRATSKAISGVARWIVALAGYSAAPEAPAEVAATPELLEAAQRSLAELVEHDNALFDLAVKRLDDQFGGEAPAAAAQTIVIVEQVRRRLHAQPAGAPPSPAEQQPAAPAPADAPAEQDSLL
jgi:hypothetical protein